MKIILKAFVLAIATMASCLEARTVHVRGYFRRDGTYVQPHFRNIGYSGNYYHTTSLSKYGFFFGEDPHFKNQSTNSPSIKIDKSRRCKVCCGCGYVRKPLTLKMMGKKIKCETCKGTGFKIICDIADSKKTK
jgi:hypothetical protein